MAADPAWLISGDLSEDVSKYSQFILTTYSRILDSECPLHERNELQKVRQSILCVCINYHGHHMEVGNAVYSEVTVNL